MKTVLTLAAACLLTLCSPVAVHAAPGKKATAKVAAKPAAKSKKTLDAAAFSDGCKLRPTVVNCLHDRRAPAQPKKK